MKLKYYMRGIGIGVILTTLILTLGNPKEKLTDTEVIGRAQELGMVMGADNKSDLEQILHPSGEAASPSVTPGLSVIPSESPTAAPTTEPSAIPTEEPTPVPTTEPVLPTVKPTKAPDPTIGPASNSDNGADITFIIKSGMSSRKVSELLLQVGLIDNADEFNQYIEGKHKASIIRTGTYSIPKGTSYDDIIRIITTEQ